MSRTGVGYEGPTQGRDPRAQAGDFRAIVMLQEAFRHLQAIGAWGDGVAVLADAGIEPDYPGVLVGKKANEKLAALGMHRAWDRTPLIAASMRPPAR